MCEEVGGWGAVVGVDVRVGAVGGEDVRGLVAWYTRGYSSGIAGGISTGGGTAE